MTRCCVCGSSDNVTIYETDTEDVGDPAGLAGYLRCTNACYRTFGRIVRCRECGLRYRSPREANILAGYEAVSDPQYVEEGSARLVTFQRSLTQLRRYTAPPGRLLDVGTYTGLFLQVAAQAGWQIAGVEPSQWAARIAGDNLGTPVYNGSLTAANLPGSSFDVVTMWDVIEHLAFPPDDLAEARRVLKPRGILALSTMDVHSLAARLLGRRWPHYMRMHLWYFSRPTLSRLLENAGFEVLAFLPHVRVLRLGYLATRLQCYGTWVSCGASRVVKALHVANVNVPIRLGDLLTVIARAPR